MMATAKPMVTTTLRKTAGLMRPANRPPSVPPSNAPTAITNAADQTTLPEEDSSSYVNTKRDGLLERVQSG